MSGEARWQAKLPGLLNTAAVASLGPDPSTGSGQGPRRGRARLPKVNVDQAIRIGRIKGPGPGDGRRGDIGKPRAATAEELEKSLMKLLAMVKRRNRKKRLAEGWIETRDGHLIPPGWVRVGTQEESEAAGGAEKGGREE
jgi:hypothetical protein